MQEIQKAFVPMFYIEYYKQNNLVDISETGYATIELAQSAIAQEKELDDLLEQDLQQQYEEKLKQFVLDYDTSDREPANPLHLIYRFEMKPQLYYYSERGYTKVEKHVIENLSNLQTDPETIETVNGILSGSIDPRNYSNVKNWLRQCYNEPNADELKMCAINQALQGYGIESVRTSKWKNGYWCDILCTYVNMGDCYITTVIHHRKHGFMIASIGDIIEKNKHVI
jgi:hypothetical protein